MNHTRDMYGQPCGGELVRHDIAQLAGLPFSTRLYRCTNCGQIGHHGTRPLTAVPGTGQTQEVSR